MQDEKLRCDFCGAPIAALDILRGRAVVVFRRRYCPICMSAAIQRGKSSSATRYNTPNPAFRRSLSLADPGPRSAPVPVPPAAATFSPAAGNAAGPSAAPVPAPRPSAAPPELPVSLMAVLPAMTAAPVPAPAAALPGVPAPRPAETPTEAPVPRIAAAPGATAAPKPSPGPQATRRLKVGEHGCGFYSSDEDRRYQLGPFLREGLENNEKVLHFLRTPSPEKILGDFRAAGLHATPYLKSGQLEIVPIGKLLGTSGVFDPAKVTERILQAADRALEEEYSRLRIAGEMTWALSSQIDIDSLVEYERMLTALAVRGKCTALCQYNVYRFDSGSLHQIRKNHPYVFAKGTAAMVLRELEPARGVEA
ncbi:MAG TPA: MEDS domain-containing protein [Planctomycetota bacterium]|nr:MEDS domain-containing protein [Planctomycetota bacterium]